MDNNALQVLPGVCRVDVFAVWHSPHKLYLILTNAKSEVCWFAFQSKVTLVSSVQSTNIFHLFVLECFMYLSWHVKCIQNVWKKFFILTWIYLSSFFHAHYLVNVEKFSDVFKRERNLEWQTLFYKIRRFLVGNCSTVSVHIVRVLPQNENLFLSLGKVQWDPLQCLEMVRIIKC